MELNDIKEIQNKIKIIEEGDINLDGESEDFIEGFKAGLQWVIDEA